MKGAYEKVEMMQDVADNRPYKPHEYDWKIRQTVPFSDELYKQTISMIGLYGNVQGRLLDVGCGGGMFEKLLREQDEFSNMEILGLDPSEDMLAQAYLKNVPGIQYASGTVMDVKETEAFDIVTAIMSHHFVKPELRERVTAQVYKVLKKNGIYIAFENIIPEDSFVKEKELDRWENFQVQAGKTKKAAAVHRARCGVFYFPLTTTQHVELLKNAGFRYVYIFWRSYMQMGIMAIK